MNKMISIVTACFNEEENIEEVYRQVKTVINSLDDYDYEHIFIDNASADSTVSKLKRIAMVDKNVKIIVNTRNFGHIRSPFHALMEAKGDAVISIVADLQDPPEMIVEFLRKWEEGYKVVAGVKEKSEESFLFFSVRRFYYSLVNRLSDTELIKNFTGFGLYDRAVIDTLRRLGDPYPYFRGLIADLGYECAKIEYKQPLRKRGFTKNNFYTLYDMAMLGITNHSKVPLRLATFTGFLVSMFSLLVGMFYLIFKLLYWKSVMFGIAPLVIGLFFFSAVQLMFIGIIGEYIGSIHTQVLHRPLVIEKERINF
jgi:glycosyltransferase involved in cell wall biosynthesis|tara:strand:+ start:804 stop:1736 length:933 start_codon:yes stop_codon:yes gene_type:complete